MKKHLGTLIAQSRHRELIAAIAEQREPRLRYPALAIEEVRRRLNGLLQLDAEIHQHEPNTIVRRLYHDAIEEEMTFIRFEKAIQEVHSYDVPEILATEIVEGLQSYDWTPGLRRSNITDPMPCENPCRPSRIGETKFSPFSSFCLRA